MKGFLSFFFLSQMSVGEPRKLFWNFESPPLFLFWKMLACYRTSFKLNHQIIIIWAKKMTVDNHAKWFLLCLQNSFLKKTALDLCCAYMVELHPLLYWTGVLTQLRCDIAPVAFLLSQVWFQNCRARHKKHVSPNHSSSAPVTAVPPSRLSPPMLEEMAYSAYVPQDGTMLTALHSYMDGRYPNI